MRTLEVALTVLVALGALVLWLQSRPLWRCVMALSCAVLAVVHAIVEGPHWQMAPIYLAVLVLLGAAFAFMTRGWLRLSAAAVLALAAASIAASWVFPMFHLPQPTGPYAVGTRTVYLEDASRAEPRAKSPGAKRQLVVQLWYPAEPSTAPFAHYRRLRESTLVSSYESEIRTHSHQDASVLAAGSPFPVLLFNHGWDGRRTGSTFLMEEMASHGYVVASIDHPYIAERVELKDGTIVHTQASRNIIIPELGTAEQFEQTWNDELAVWTADQIFVLNWLQAESTRAGSVWQGRVNTSLAGAMGHSFGGSAAFAVSAADPRVRSAINFDGWTMGGIAHRTTDKPLLFFYGDLDSARIEDPVYQRPPQTVSDVLAKQDLDAIVHTLATYGGMMINLTLTNHADFTDQALVTRVGWLRRRSVNGPIAPAEVEAIVRAYTLAFFDQTVKGKPSPLLDPATKPPYPEVTFREWRPAN